MGLAGSGTVLTSETPIASPPPPAPQISPRRPGSMLNRTITPVNATCSPTERARGRPSFPCSKKISAFASILFERLGHDAHIGDAGSLDRVYDGRESSKRNVFVCADEYRLVLRVADFLAQPGLDLVDVDRVVSEEHPLLLVDADHHALFGDLFHGAGFGNADFDPRLQHRSGHHEDDQQHQHHVDQRSNVDIRDGTLGAPVGSRERHQRRTPAVSAAAWGTCMRSMAFIISREKSSPRAASSRIELPIRL